MKHICLLFILFSAITVMAQDSLPNGGFEMWHGGYFSPGKVACCGAALASPTYWGTPENLMAMPTNQFVFKEEDAAYIHSGHFSARLLTDITTIDSAGDVAGGIAVLVPGAVTCAGIVGYGGLGMTGDPYQTIACSLGAPFTGTPGILYFYLMFNHDVADTARYAYALTRWDSVNLKRDTLAASDVDIPDGNYSMMQWLLFSDTIHYVMAGTPDTLHLIFFGGRNADSTKAGNVTWLDDVSFDHPIPADTTTGVISLNSDKDVSVYPNPASETLHVAIAKYTAGCSIELYDMTGTRVMCEPIAGIVSSCSLGGLPDGMYLYRLLDSSYGIVSGGKLTVMKQ